MIDSGTYLAITFPTTETYGFSNRSLDIVSIAITSNKMTTRTMRVLSQQIYFCLFFSFHLLVEIDQDSCKNSL